jgi:hypothetical protein
MTGTRWQRQANFFNGINRGIVARNLQVSVAEDPVAIVSQPLRKKSAGAPGATGAIFYTNSQPHLWPSGLG